MLGAGAILVGLSFLDCRQTALAVTLLTLALTVSGFVVCGYFVNHMDIAPRYAGTLMGITNGLSASAGFIAPYVVSVVTVSVSNDFLFTYLIMQIIIMTGWLAWRATL